MKFQNSLAIYLRAIKVFKLRQVYTLLLCVLLPAGVYSLPPPPPCPDCSNSVQDCSETGVDCGGPDCAACASIIGPSFLWAKGMGGAGADYAYSVAVDASGNIYTTGIYVGVVDFDPGPGVTTLSSIGGFADIYVSKLNAAGGFVWARSMGGAGGFDYPLDIALDGSGNIYTTGYFNGTADFDPGGGTVNLTASGVFDIFVSKLDASGTYVWAINMGGAASDQAHSIVVESGGDFYLTGSFGLIADFDPTPGTYNLGSAGGNDIFVCKMDAGGGIVWASAMGGIGVDIGHSLAVDGSGNVYSTGYFSGTADFDPGGGITNLTSSGLSDMYISKLDASGNFVWARQLTSAFSFDRANSIAVDGSGNVYTTGSFSNTTDFDPSGVTYNLTTAGLKDMFISKLDAAGNFVWAKQMGGAGNDYASSMALDASFLYIAGDQYTGTVDYDPGAGTFDVPNTGSEANIVSKYDLAGNFVCAFSITPGHNETVNNRQLAIDGGGGVYITGSFDDPTTDFDPCTPVFNLPNNGGLDLYVAKYNMSTCDCSLLPITLSSFSGENMGEYNLLKWVTESEVNNDHFILERSLDANVFYAIDRVAGAGNSDVINTYQYTDENVSLYKAELYYRLKQVDYDGQYTYSNTISIRPGSTQLPVIQQTADNLIISMDDIADQGATIYIYDILGREVYHERVKVLQAYKLSLNRFKTGNYYIHIQAGGKDYRQKLIIY